MGVEFDRRRQPRSDIVGQLWGSLEVPQTLVLRNLSRGGALFEAREPLPVLSKHRMRLALDDAEAEVEVCVRHVRRVVDPDGLQLYVIALEFDWLPPSIIDRIDQLVGAESGAERPTGRDDG